MRTCGIYDGCVEFETFTVAIPISASFTRHLDVQAPTADAALLLATEHALSLAARSGCLVSGGKRVREALTDDKCLGLLFSVDASPRLRRDLLSRREGILELEIALDQGLLGAQIGKGPRAAIAIISSKPGRHLIRELQRHLALR